MEDPALMSDDSAISSDADSDYPHPTSVGVAKPPANRRKTSNNAIPARSPRPKRIGKRNQKYAATANKTDIKRDVTVESDDVTDAKEKAGQSCEAYSGGSVGKIGGENQRVLMREWLKIMAESGRVGGVCWHNAEKTQIRIQWKHGSRTGWTLDDCQVFRAWANHTGKGHSEPKKWKANFRCALHSLSDVRHMKHLSKKGGHDPFMVYELQPEKNKKSSPKRVKKCSAAKDKLVTPSLPTYDSLLSDRLSTLGCDKEKPCVKASPPCYWTPGGVASDSAPKLVTLTSHRISSCNRSSPAVRSPSLVETKYEVPYSPQHGIIPTTVLDLQEDAASDFDTLTDDSIYCTSPGSSSTSSGFLSESQTSGYSSEYQEYCGEYISMDMLEGDVQYQELDAIDMKDLVYTTEEWITQSDNFQAEALALELQTEALLPFEDLGLPYMTVL